ncbi:hypothetical protein VC83_09234 [Pseudogymnoascus destructans]|uniref:Uncharacterized protein n=1 Tax=Pseudogymnoascus destructans TaxID=655981 RepID=A0A176ZZJ2_9PEZI|nr:uncharacterized protein VC83_09234 [Pseudogymnoascus destructans]OAF54451.1 hypothetical protein VC83_09234 [Pseudogymnoascus destructans]
MAISNFLNPIDEQINNTEVTTDEEGILQEILDEHLSDPTQNDEQEEEPETKEAVYSASDARNALKVLIEYMECQDALQADHLRALERLEGEIEAIQLNSLVQETLDKWIT